MDKVTYKPMQEYVKEKLDLIFIDVSKMLYNEFMKELKRKLIAGWKRYFDEYKSR